MKRWDGHALLVVAREARPEGKQSLLIAWVDPLNEDRSGRGEVVQVQSKVESLNSMLRLMTVAIVNGTGGKPLYRWIMLLKA